MEDNIFNNILGNDRDYFNELVEGATDLEILMIATRLLKNAQDRLNNDMENKKVIEEYNKISNICNELDNIIKNNLE